MSPEQSIVVRSKLPCISGLRIAMRTHGQGDPLLLINGMTRPLQSWDAFTRVLHGRTVVSFDLPGVGGSPTPLRPLSIAEFATVGAAVLDAAGIGEADVLGLSLGGAVAQQLAHDAPDRVRRMVLAATSCGMGATPGGGRAIVRGLGRPADVDAWPAPDPLGLWWQSIAVSTWSSIPFLGSIQAPTLVVCGSRDTVVHPDNSRVLARRIPNATLVVLPGAGHDLQRKDRANALARVVEDFLPTRGTTRELRTVS